MITIEHQVRERAYYIWEGEGRVCGRAHAHWIQAEAELAAMAGEAETVSAEALPAVEKAAPAPKAKAAARPKAAAPKAAAGKAAAPKAAAKKASRKAQTEGIALH